MYRLSNKTAIPVLLCSAIMLVTPAQASDAPRTGGASATAGINSTVTKPSTTPAIGAMNNATAATQNTANAGAGTTRRMAIRAAGITTAMSNVQANAGASVSPGVSANGDVNSTDVSNNAASVNRATQTSAGKMSHKAQVNADAAETLATRQLNQQQASVSAGGSAKTTVQQ